MPKTRKSARRNASKLNQSVKTAKAYRKRIDACYYHLSKGLKKEPNDTNGPDLTTKIKELQIAIRNAERERAKSEARIAKLKEGGISVDEYIDALVYEVEETQAVPGANRGLEATNTGWGDNESNNEQVLISGNSYFAKYCFLYLELTISTERCLFLFL